MAGKGLGPGAHVAVAAASVSLQQSDAGHGRTELAVARGFDVAGPSSFAPPAFGATWSAAA